ncbi:MFS transporter [Streptomyces sp. BE133]|uniref:MFS transporter n=1 Tax=Streptomyces sp. BE133 TaxID=3002523 RepID=UPI002E7951C1|nr:MFS transporter [Streptomyces sp. BE133]MEE1807783.1 MFS transporter [Streptomyces sp. BE133]
MAARGFLEVLGRAGRHRCRFRDHHHRHLGHRRGGPARLDHARGTDRRRREAAPALLLSLHAGVFADRYRKRPIIISCDVLCAVTLASITVVQLVAEIALGQLYAVAFLVSAFQVIGSNASISYLPILLRGEQLKEGNSKLGAANSLADLTGNNLGGLLVTVLGAARAIALDALSYLICAFCLLRIRHREPEPAPRPAGTSQWTEIREGLDYTLKAPLVRSIVLSNATTSFALAASSALWSLYLLRELDWSPAVLGIVMGGVAGSAGSSVPLLNAETHGLDGQPEPVNASALIHDGRGRCLLHLRDQREGIWEPGVFALLGGGRKTGDPCLEATLRRELAEEVPHLTPYAVEEATSVDGLAVPIQVYTGRWNGDPDTVNLQEGVLLRWFTPDMLDRLRLSPGLGDLVRRHATEHPAAKGAPDTIHLSRDETPAGTELHNVGVHLYLQDEHDRILLGLRHPNSQYAPNEWHFLAVH